MTSVLPPARRTRPPNRRELILDLMRLVGYDIILYEKVS